MVSVKSFIAAAAVTIVSATAYAADMPMPPPPQIVYQQAPCCETGRWYLRGDVGVGVQSFSSIRSLADELHVRLARELDDRSKGHPGHVDLRHGRRL